VNSTYILEGLSLPLSGDKIIEPFAGKGDLITWIGEENIEAYDIDPKKRI